MDREDALGRRWPAVGGIVAAVAVVIVLAVTGALSGGDGEPRSTGPYEPEGGAAREAESAPRSEPTVEEIEVGGRPTTISAGEGAVWLADSFSGRATRLDPSATRNDEGIELTLTGSATDVSAGEGGVWYALSDQQAVERRDPASPQAAGERIEVDGPPSAVATGEHAVWVLTDNAVERVEPPAGEVEDRIAVGGFGTALAVAEGAVWAVADNREVVRIDPLSGEREDEPVEVPDAIDLAVGHGHAWVLTASGEVTSVDARSLAVAKSPARVPGALDLAAGEGGVWVTSSRRTLTRLDPATGEVVGEPIRVGEEPSAVSVGEGAVWVANAGDGTVSRIEP